MMINQNVCLQAAIIFTMIRHRSQLYGICVAYFLVNYGATLSGGIQIIQMLSRLDGAADGQVSRLQVSCCCDWIAA